MVTILSDLTHRRQDRWIIRVLFILCQFSRFRARVQFLQSLLHLKQAVNGEPR